MSFLRLVLPALALTLALAREAGAEVELARSDLGATASGVLGVLALSIVPSETASLLSIGSGNADDANLFATQLGGAFTYSEELPIYLEGFLGYARYDPRYVFSLEQDEQTVKARWNNYAATVGLGWDFPLTDALVFRPIGNFSLGHVESDASFSLPNAPGALGDDLDFLQDGEMDAFGLGGSLMLDYERRRAAYEADVELRYTYIHLQSFGGSSSVDDGSARAETLGLWSRGRVPTGIEAFDRPLRAVGEVSASLLLGHQRLAIGSDYLLQIGGGVELDVGENRPFYLERVRLMGRYVFGDDVRGFTFGLGLSW